MVAQKEVAKKTVAKKKKAASKSKSASAKKGKTTKTASSKIPAKKKASKKSASTVAESTPDYLVDLDTTEPAEMPAVEVTEFQPDPNLSPYENAAAKVRTFPQAPGVYLMKDAAGVVIYVGKATNLRSRAGSYFLKAAMAESRTATWVQQIADADFIACESEVDALLVESRLIKDIQPAHNKVLKDDKTFPYLQISTHEDFPRVEVTREPASKGVKALRTLRQRRIVTWCDSSPAAHL